MEGWCPQGGWAEDLTEPPGLLALYPELRETHPDDPQVQDVIRRYPVLQGLACSDPAIRTVMNVEASDVLLTLTRQAALSGGTNLAVDTARALGMPELTVLLDNPEQAAEQLRRFLAGLPHGAVVDLNGPRGSEAQGIYEQVRALLGGALRELQDMPSVRLDSVELDLITHLGTGQHDEPYVTGVYLPDDTERVFCYLQRGSQTLQEAREVHSSLLASWQDPAMGSCLHCGASGWIVDDAHYCRGMGAADGCEPEICLECTEDERCETHREEA